MKDQFDLVVIGGGEAGMEAALRGTELGAKVCVVEIQKSLGGACVDTGTLPSKALNNSARILETLRKTDKFGIKLQGDFGFDFQDVLNSRNRTTRCERGAFDSILRKQGIERIVGRATLKAKHLVAVETEDRSTKELKTSKILIATGSTPLELPGFPFDGKKILSTDDLLDLKILPQDILIVGAGSIGCEYAFIFKSFGAEVILVEKRAHPLWGHDQEMVSLVEKEFKRKGIKFLSQVTLKSVQKKDTGEITVHLGNGEELTTEKVLICAGRKPYTEGLNLENIGVKKGARGEILVNELMETSVSGIYAAGDVLGKGMLTSTAKMEAAAAADNALGAKRKVDYQNIPSGIYTDPEVAAVGLTEEECKKKRISFVVGKCKYSDLLKACSLDELYPGLIKLLFQSDSHRIIGAHIIGLEATEVIHQLALAVKLEARAEDLKNMVFNHPTISEGVGKAAKEALKKLEAP